MPRIVFVDQYRFIVSAIINGPDGHLGTVPFLVSRKACTSDLNQALDQILTSLGTSRGRIPWKRAPAVNFRALPGNSEKYKRATDVRLTQTAPAPTLKTCSTTIIRRRRPIEAD
jgi:hypothetical protein